MEEAQSGRRSSARPAHRALDVGGTEVSMVACSKRGTDGGAPLTEVDQGRTEVRHLNTDSKYLGISTDLIPCNNPSRYPPLFVIHGTWTIKGP